jgi:hypothetical protein
MSRKRAGVACNHNKNHNLRKTHPPNKQNNGDENRRPRINSSVISLINLQIYSGTPVEENSLFTLLMACPSLSWPEWHMLSHHQRVIRPPPQSHRMTDVFCWGRPSPPVHPLYLERIATRGRPRPSLLSRFDDKTRFRESAPEIKFRDRVFSADAAHLLKRGLGDRLADTDSGSPRSGAGGARASAKPPEFDKHAGAGAFPPTGTNN